MVQLINKWLNNDRYASSLYKIFWIEVKLTLHFLPA